MMKFPWRYQRIYIYPNRFGFLFFAVFAVAIAIGATYQNNLVFLFGFLLISFLFVVILLTAKNLRHIEILSPSSDGQFPNLPGQFSATVANPSKIPRVDLHLAHDRKAKSHTLEVLMPGEERRVHWTSPPQKMRGVYRASRVRISTEGPFGLFYSWLWQRFELPYHVFPEPRGTLPLPKTAGASDPEVIGLRPYVAGDRPSRIHWKTLAKTGALAVKDVETVSGDHLLLSDQSLLELETEERLSQLTKWILEAETTNEPYVVQWHDWVSGVGHGRDHMNTVLRRLAEVPHP
jgi:uncharacterized protein (DUF58 family)